MVAQVRSVDAKIFWGIFDDGAGKLDWVRGGLFFKKNLAQLGCLQVRRSELPRLNVDVDWFVL